eukprot:TRINITY_DN75211_c0_g2_i1.p1 TRINITY_DN75211_c0_g2~~TRINITY_DN75211_c0_g2_i1.p1  ORF type:complete len:470 (-),score=81.82 TRINITY_DN75211_c0_g2_i1:30-1439(-)
MISASVFLVGFWLSVIFYLSCIVTYFIRRDNFPIKQRQPRVVLVELVLMMFVPLECLLSAAFPDHAIFSNCQFFMLITTIFVHIPVMIMGFRIFWLFFKDFRTKTIIRKFSQSFASVQQLHLEDEELSSMQVTSPKSKNPLSRQTENFVTFFLEKRRWNLNQISGILILPGALIALADSLIVFSNREIMNFSIWSEQCGEALFNESQGLHCIIFAYFGVVLMFMIFSLLHINDNFHLGTEIRALLVLAVGITVSKVCTSVPVLYKVIFLQTRIWSFLVGWILMPLVYCASSVYPIYLSFKHQRKKKQFEASQRMNGLPSYQVSTSNVFGVGVKDVIHCLENPQSRSAFAKFLESEFSVENLFFIEAVKRFKANCISSNGDDETKRKIFEEARKIQEVFINPSATYCINISFPVRSETLKLCEQAVASQTIEPVMFDKAHDEVLRMMTRDSFVRFAMSKQYGAIINNRET